MGNLIFPTIIYVKKMISKFHKYNWKPSMTLSGNFWPLKKQILIQPCFLSRNHYYEYMYFPINPPGGQTNKDIPNSYSKSMLIAGFFSTDFT
jgi:hypothetical protein